MKKTASSVSTSPGSPGSSTLSGTSTVASNPSAPTFSSESTAAASRYTPDEYERTSYYNGVTGDDDHPVLVYRSDFAILFPKPTGRYAHIPIKSLRGVFNTPLNGVWDTVGPKICNLIKARKIQWSSVDPARFLTHGSPGEKGSLGPVVVWIGVRPGSTSSDTAHEVSQEILELLSKNGVEDAVVEWREAVRQTLAGPPLMRHVGSLNATHHARHFLTALLSVPLAAEEMAEEDAQGTLTLWFHENKTKNGDPSDKVYGVSNCHVLHKNTTVDYEHKGGTPRNHVRVCGVRRFQRGLDDIRQQISNRGIIADYYAREIAALEGRDPQNEDEIEAYRRELESVNRAIASLKALYEEVKGTWCDIPDRNIGYVQYAPAITVDVKGGTRYTSDWGAFLAAEAKVRDGFEGNVVDLGSKFSPDKLTTMLYPRGGGSTAFKFPLGRKLRVEGCATKEDLAHPTEFDSDGQPCLIVGKDGNTTDLTVGRYAGLVSFTQNEVGIESIELGIYNSGFKSPEPFSDKGDSGSLVWHTKDGKARIVGQLHSGVNKGGSTSNHVTYCTPGWYLLNEIKKKYKYADFYRTTWA